MKNYLSSWFHVEQEKGTTIENILVTNLIQWKSIHASPSYIISLISHPSMRKIHGSYRTKEAIPGKYVYQFMSTKFVANK